jgi:hypothetical protein
MVVSELLVVTVLRHRLLIVALSVAAMLPASAGAATWTTPTTVASSADVQFQLAMGADGTAALTWASAGAVRAAVKRPGRPWGSPVRVSDGRFAVARPAVAVSGRGEVIVAWVQSGTRNGHPAPTTGPLTIRARARGTSGGWGAIRQIGTTGHFIEAGIDLAANAQGETIAVWSGVRRLANGRTTQAVQSAFRRPAQAFGGTQTIRDPESERLTVTGQVVALDSRGTAYAAYDAGTSPVVRLATRARGASGSWHAPRNLAGAPSSNPVIDVTAGRTAIVAWRASELDSEGNGIQSGLLDARSRAPTGTLSASQRLSATPTRNYRLAVAPSGEALLAWVPSASGAAELRYATRPPVGPFGPAQLVAGVAPAGDFHGGLAALGDGTFLETYTTANRVRVIARPPAATFNPTPELDTGGLYPLVAAAGRRAVAAWVVPKGDAVRLVASARTA